MNPKSYLKTVISSDLNKKIVGFGSWLLIGNIISKSFLLFATIFMARFLGKQEYGQFGILKSTILMFSMFAGLELGITATKYISQYKFSNKSKLEKIVGLSTLLALLVSVLITTIIFIYAPIIAKYLTAPQLFAEVRISSFILFFASLNGIQNGILSGLEKFKALSINTTISGVVSSLGMVVASFYQRLDLVVIAFGTNYLILFLLNFFILRLSFYSHFTIRIFDLKNFEEIDILWKFSFPAILAGLMVAPTSWICNFWLANQKDGFEELAIFDVANQWRGTILFIPAALAQIVLPLLSSSLDDRDEYRNVFDKNLRINLILGMFLVIFFVLLSPIIVKFYGDKYNDALFPLIIMFTTTGFLTVNNVIGHAIASQGKMWIGFFVNFLWAIVLLISCYLLVIILQLGAIGVSFSYLISYIFHTIIQFFYIKKLL